MFRFIMNYFPVDYAVMNLVENNLEKVSEYLKKEFKDPALSRD